jgi:SAM-dependent methyltransferase
LKKINCHHCYSDNLEVVPNSDRLHRVTSDAKPRPTGFQIGHCRDCELVQTVVTPEWHEEVKSIYKDYTIYSQGNGIEQSVFLRDGIANLRSSVILQNILSDHLLPVKGSLLDIGCGNGAFLEACSRALPNWDFQGSEFNDRYQQKVEAISGVSAMHIGKLEDVEGSFDVISMIHVLEHIPDPVSVLKNILPRLTPDGMLIVEVPDCSLNPYMLMVADHCSHFSPESLTRVVRNAGFGLSEVSIKWVPREISLIARPFQNTCHMIPSVSDSNNVLQGFDWLVQIKEQLTNLSINEKFAIFGTSIAATWLQIEIDNKAAFFVDEDQNRVGGMHLGKIILSPQDLPDGVTVYIALPHSSANEVAQRLKSLNKKLKIIMPPKRG